MENISLMNIFFCFLMKIEFCKRNSPQEANYNQRLDTDRYDSILWIISKIEDSVWWLLNK